MVDEQTADYFDTLVECAKLIAETIPEDGNGKSFFRKRIQESWHELNSYMSSAFPDIRMAGGKQFSVRLNDLLASLARECLMAVWYLGIQAEDGEDNPEVVAAHMLEITAHAKIKV